MIPGKGLVAEPGLVEMAPGSGVIKIAPVSVCHQVSTIGQRPRPITSRYHIHASGYRLSYASQQPEALHLVFARPLLAQAHERANGGWRRIENAHLIFFDDPPEAIRLRPRRRSFIHQRGRAVLEWTVNHVAVAGHPSDIGCTPKSIFLSKIENPFRCDVGSNSVSTGCMQDAFGLSSGSRSVEQVERMFGVQRLGRALR